MILLNKLLTHAHVCDVVLQLCEKLRIVRYFIILCNRATLNEISLASSSVSFVCEAFNAVAQIISLTSLIT